MKLSARARAIARRARARLEALARRWRARRREDDDRIARVAGLVLLSVVSLLVARHELPLLLGATIGPFGFSGNPHTFRADRWSPDSGVATVAGSELDVLATTTTVQNISIRGSCTLSDGSSCGSGGSGGGGSGTPGSTSIDPTTLGTVAAWFKSDANVYSDTACTAVATTGGTVGCWGDSSGNLHNFVASAAGRKPRYDPGARANHPVVTFNSPDLNASALTGTGSGLNLASYTVCGSAWTIPANGGLGALIMSLYVNFNEGGGNGVIFDMLGEGSFWGTRAAGPYEGVLLVGGGWTGVDQTLLCETFDSTSKVNDVWYDGAKVATRVAAAGISYAGATPVIGSLRSDGSAEKFYGSMSELILYDSQLSDANIATVFQYLRERSNKAYGQGGGSSSGGGGVTDPLTVNGWTPNSGTATITGAAHVTAAETVDGNFSVGGSASFTGAVTMHSTLDLTNHDLANVDVIDAAEGDISTVAADHVTSSIDVTSPTYTATGNASYGAAHQVTIAPGAGYGVQMTFSGGQPACNGVHDAMLWHVAGTALVKGKFQACECTSLGSCAWTDLD